MKNSYLKLPKKPNGVFKENLKEKKLYLSDKKKLTFKGITWLMIKYLLLIAIALLIIYPIFYLVISSINGSLPNQSLQSQKSFTFTMEHFSYLNDTSYWTWMFNSLIIGFVCMFVVVLFSGLMAYGFSRYTFSGKKSWLIFILLIGLIPNLMSLIIFYILSDIIFINLGLPRMVVLILLYSGGGIVGNLYILKAYMDGISHELDDSGKIDGLSNWKLFTRIIAPLAKPMLSIVAFWSFLAPFGDVILSSIILFDEKDWTIPIGLMSFINNPDLTLINYPAFAAGSLVVALPIVITFLVLQKNISSGLAAGGVKG